MRGLFLLFVGYNFCWCYTYPRTVKHVLEVMNGHGWGSWHPPSFCAEGHFAYGYTMKIEGNQHGHDDTALNSVVLRCTSVEKYGSHGGEIASGEGEYGDWVGYTDCHSGDFITKFSLQVEPAQGHGDDTAANYIKFKCRNLSATENEYEMVRPPGHGLFGTYGGWSDSCPANTAVCGIQTRIEGPQGGNGDDTSLNNVKLFCCT